MHNHHVDWMPSHWIIHKLDKLTTVEALWITPMFDVAQSCLPFLFITSLTSDLHCNSILCICQHKLANRDRQHSNMIVTANVLPVGKSMRAHLPGNLSTVAQHCPVGICPNGVLTIASPHASEHAKDCKTASACTSLHSRLSECSH